MDWIKHQNFIFNVLHSMGAKITDMCGRTVLILPIKDWGYLPISEMDEVYQEWVQERQEWVLVVEEDGNTWVWDSWIMEG
jgi:hypothetical protein|tara:strand:- start:35 stop:274 length:240 start_codon:yes stop_codon:yes gene_type:complete